MNIMQIITLISMISVLVIWIISLIMPKTVLKYTLQSEILMMLSVALLAKEAGVVAAMPWILINAGFAFFTMWNIKRMNPQVTMEDIKPILEKQTEKDKEYAQQMILDEEINLDVNIKINAGHDKLSDALEWGVPEDVYLEGMISRHSRLTSVPLAYIQHTISELNRLPDKKRNQLAGSMLISYMMNIASKSRSKHLTKMALEELKARK